MTPPSRFTVKATCLSKNHACSGTVALCPRTSCLVSCSFPRTSLSRSVFIKQLSSCRTSISVPHLHFSAFFALENSLCPSKKGGSLRHDTIQNQHRHALPSDPQRAQAHRHSSQPLAAKTHCRQRFRGSKTRGSAVRLVSFPIATATLSVLAVFSRQRQVWSAATRVDQSGSCIQCTGAESCAGECDLAVEIAAIWSHSATGHASMHQGTANSRQLFLGARLDDFLEDMLDAVDAFCASPEEKGAPFVVQSCSNGGVFVYEVSGCCSSMGNCAETI